MLAVVVVLIAMVLLLGVLVVGLLRSHADIIRALHSLGVGVGDPAAGDPSGGVETPVALRTNPALLNPPLPSERNSTSVFDLEGRAPGGDELVVSVSTAGETLLAFLSSGCTSCQAFWSALGDPAQRALLPASTRVVVVTKGPEWESADTIAAKAPPGITVIMSTAAWSDYEVPGSPFFVLVDGEAGRRIGEGVAHQLSQVADLVGRADVDARGPFASTSAPSRAMAVGLNGAEREQANDEELRRAGIHPGDPSLYPRGLDDVFASTAHLARPGPEATSEPVSTPTPQR
ncbi:MAG: hypothetical protein FWC87_01300 [Acidimicrobiaceae bacterium]|nr:hypothetical protein [Acidimicrobiaceae bacterium]